MRIYIDTESKEISIEDNINLGEFLDEIKNLIPNEDWREYTLIKSNSENIIVVQEYPYNPYSPYFDNYWEATYSVN